MQAHADTIQLVHPDREKIAPRIAKTKYDAVRTAILKAVPPNSEGVPFTGLADAVAMLLPATTLATLGSVGWYTTAVKLDLEARGEIERIPGTKPQRLRRAQRTPVNGAPYEPITGF
jgi:hypothetical protein